MRVISPPRLRTEEQAVAALPPIQGRGGESWNQRLNLHPGRSLTATALAIEQQHKERHLARLGRSLSPGVVEGLEASVDPGPPGGPDRLVVAPGRGLLPDGQDVVLTQARALSTLELVTLDAATSLPATAEDEPPPAPSGLGVLLLVPIQLDQDASAPETAEGAFDPCPDDLSRIAFTDFRRYDGVLLAFHPRPLDFPPFQGAFARRNRLAYEIFRREASAPLPWSGFGVPLAVLELDEAGRVSLFDRAAVVRRGGAAVARRPTEGLVPSRGTPFLWQARLQQLAAQVADELAAGWDARHAADRFRFLPPAGVLPRIAFDAGFFPSTWHRLAAPVPLQQLELAMAAAAGLAPFDLETTRTELVKWLVPVPEEVYDPRLLETAFVDPAFDQTVSALLAATSGARARRDQLRYLARLAARLIDPARLAAFPEDDRLAVPLEDPSAEPSPALEPADAFAESRATQPLLDLKNALAATGRFPGPELEAIDAGRPDDGSFRGLTAFADGLRTRLDRADDRVDLGFTRLQAELYRVRQIMLDNEEATRLATSPVLAGIVQQGVSAVATSAAIGSYFKAERGIARRAAAINLDLDRAAPTALLARPLPEASLSVRPRIEPLAPPVDLGRIVKEGRVELAGAFFGRDPKTVRDEIILKAPIPGEVKEFRSVTIADRLRLSAALEAKSAAVRLKSELLTMLRDLDLPLDGLEAPLNPAGTAVLPGPTLQKLLSERFNSDQRQIVERVLLPRRQMLQGTSLQEEQSLVVLNVGPLSAQELQLLEPIRPVLPVVDSLLAEAGERGRVSSLADKSLVDAAKAGRLNPDPRDGDEGAFLAAAIDVLEGTVALLRAVEGRILELRAHLDRSTATLLELETVLAEWRSALTEADRQLAERRHDLTVARALRAEEQARMDAVNRRRREILEREAPFVAYIRPRLASPLAGRTALPRRRVLGRLEDPVVPCLDQPGEEPPAELEQMLTALRQVPLGWLRVGDALLDRLDRPAALETLYVAAVERARTLVAVAGPAPAAPSISLIATWQGLGRRLIAARAEIDLKAAVQGRGWRAVKERSLRELSLDDLLESGRRQPALVRAAGEELEQIGRVAACLLDRLRALPVAVRLAWVQALSQFDAAADLASLDRLPRFAEVPADQRRELGRLVAWLFGRLTPDVAEARSLMSDIVRVAILLAGQAPVAALVRATLAREVTGRVGENITVVFPADRARIGLAVELRTPAGELVAGVVEDLLPDAARIRLTRAPATRVTLPAATEIRLLATAPRRVR